MKQRALGRGGQIHLWFQRYPLVTDGLFAIAFAAFVLIPMAAMATEQPPELRPTPSMALWTVVGLTPIVMRRVLPWWSVLLATALQVSSPLYPHVWIGLNFALLVVAYTAAAHLSFRQAVAASVLLWSTLSVMIVTVIPEEQLGMASESALIVNYLSALALFAIGRMVYARRGRFEELSDRARLAEENQAALVRQAINDERRRIARELHDVVAHHISVMGVLATGARRVLHKQPDKADEALATIETTGRATLREMRRLLDVLRSSDEPEHDDELAPQPGLDAVHALVAQIRDAGLAVNLRVEGEPYPLDPGIALTVYRIVQEGLTNTLKHAGPARAGVRIEYGDHGIDLEVSDTGVGPRVSATTSGRVGHGLVGMRERVALYGGTLRTGPRPGGGFRVHAAIPIDTATAPLGTDTGGDR
ncbi:sensor histidine kinase [Stackebrandtia endophytica]|nr:sensor histidine kinase [Stackebrandtia endophytica]